MRKFAIRWMVLCLLVAGSVACRQKESEGSGAGNGAQTGTPAVAATDTATPTPPSAVCPTPTCRGGATCLTEIDATASKVPEIACTSGESGNQVAEQADIFAWNQFIALNWPANLADCTPNQGRSIRDVKSQDGTFVVWQTYMPGADVFVPPGQQVAPWCGGNRLAQGENRVIESVAKAHPHAVGFDRAFASIAEPEEDVQASGPRAILVDQSGRWVRYERLMNRKEYDYIVGKELYRASTLKAMADKSQDVSLPTGTIEVKAAWKVLTAGELESRRFFTTRARVNNTRGGKTTDACDRDPVWLGLVGLHIVHKTPGADQMVWSTFEHVDNDRIFYNPARAGSIEDNQQPKRPADGRYRELGAPPECKPLLEPTQVKRLTKPAANPALNEYYRQKLKGSVFENYRLIATAFPLGGTGGNYPPQVANITMETYAQLVSKEFGNLTWTGCFGCHINAGTTFTKPNGQNQLTNQSFFFLEVK
jgi:hypothetical protein